MKIAVIVNCLKIGGMERVAVNLSDAFHEDGHSTDLIYLKDRKKEIEPRNSDIPVRLFNLKKSVLSSGIGIVWLIICQIFMFSTLMLKSLKKSSKVISHTYHMLQ